MNARITDKHRALAAQILDPSGAATEIERGAQLIANFVTDTDTPGKRLSDRTREALTEHIGHTGIRIFATRRGVALVCDRCQATLFECLIPTQ